MKEFLTVLLLFTGQGSAFATQPDPALQGLGKDAEDAFSEYVKNPNSKAALENVVGAVNELRAVGITTKIPAPLSVGDTKFKHAMDSEISRSRGAHVADTRILTGAALCAIILNFTGCPEHIDQPVKPPQQLVPVQYVGGQDETAGK